MGLTFATVTSRILQFLQDTGATTYDATETGNSIEGELRRLSGKSPVLVDVIYKVESRTGTETAGTASTLTDTTKAQFLSTDDDYEKVVHNTTDNTWAVVTGYTSTSVLSISKDIMAVDEEYEIYNKRCRNKRQIYIGDMPPFLWIESVEYPVGTERNFIEISREIIELDVDDSTIQDSDSTLTTLNKVDVLIKFALPQVLNQMANLAGAVHTAGAVDATTMQVKSFTDAQVVKVGTQFRIAGQMTTYTVITQLTLADQAGVGSSLAFFPGLEAATTAGDVITFIGSTLQPNHEDLLERMVVSRAIQSDMIRFAKSGAPLVDNYLKIIGSNPRLNDAIIERELQALVHSRPAKRLSRE